MKDLYYIIKRMTQKMLAEKLGLKKANITLWKSKNAVPKKHYFKLKEIKNELAAATRPSIKK